MPLVRVLGAAATCAAGALLASCVSRGPQPPSLRPTPPGATEGPVARAALTLRHACDLGDANGCADLGMLLLQGAEGVDRNTPGALGLLAAACDAGSALGCVRLGDAQLRGIGVPPSAARAADLFGRACERGDAAGCRHLGELFARGDGVTLDPQRAQSLWDRACSGGDGRACDDLGSAALAAGANARNARRAADLYERACDLDDEGGCGHLGAAYFTGTGRTRDVDRGVALLERGCEGDDPWSCDLVARILSRGEAGVERDMVQAVRFWQQSCAAGDAKGCERAGAVRACRGGARGICDALATEGIAVTTR